MLKYKKSILFIVALIVFVFCMSKGRRIENEIDVKYSADWFKMPVSEYYYIDPNTIGVNSTRIPSEYFNIGDKLRIKQIDADRYFYVTSTTDSSIIIHGEHDSTFLDIEIQEFSRSRISNPIGFPSVFTYFPTVYDGSGVVIPTWTTKTYSWWIIGTVLYAQIRLLTASNPASNNIIYVDSPFPNGFNSLTSETSLFEGSSILVEASWQSLIVPVSGTFVTSFESLGTVFPTGSLGLRSTMISLLNLYKKMAYTAWSVVALEQPTTGKWNILGANDAYMKGRFDAMEASPARAYLSGVQSIPTGADTEVELDTEDFDIGDNFNTTTYKYVVPTTGIYQINASVLLSELDDGKKIFVRIKVDSTTKLRAQSYSPGANLYPSAVISGKLNLTAGEEITMSVEHDNGGNLNTSADASLTFFDIALHSTQ